MQSLNKNIICFLLLNVIVFTAKPQALWSPNLIFGEVFYPSYAIANSTFKVNFTAIKKSNIYGDLQGQLGIEVNNLALQDYTLKVQIECDELAKTSVEEIRVGAKARKFFFYPHLDYKWEALRKNEQSRPVTAKITAWVDGKSTGTKLVTFSLLSINSCPYTCITKSNELLDLNYMYAAYVNEDSPIINDVLLKEMFAQGAIKQITGYQTADAKEVYKQVFAVWNVLRKRGISYSSLTATTKNTFALPIVLQQYVRTIEDALQNKQANCVDGTVLMASILYRMGIKPYIVTLPNHCFLGYSLNADESAITYLETTALGMEVPAQGLDIAKKSPFFDAALYEKFGSSYISFLLATNSGINTREKNKQDINNHTKLISLSIITDNNRADLIHKLQYQMFPVDVFKQYGLQPIFK